MQTVMEKVIYAILLLVVVGVLHQPASSHVP